MCWAFSLRPGAHFLAVATVWADSRLSNVVISVPNFLGLTSLEPHQDLLKRGAVVRATLEMDG